MFIFMYVVLVIFSIIGGLTMGNFMKLLNNTSNEILAFIAYILFLLLIIMIVLQFKGL